MPHELSKTRKRGETSPIEQIIADAVKVACDYLVPQGFDAYVWKTLTARRTLLRQRPRPRKPHGEFAPGRIRNWHAGFGVKEYQPLLASGKANQTRLKTASEFGTRLLGNRGFSDSLVRHALFAMREMVRTGEVQPGKNWLRTEVRDYWQQRKSLLELLRYFSTMGLKLPHWQVDAKAAQLLAGAVENDNV